MNLNLKKRLNTIERFMKSVRLVLYFNRVFDLYELMNVEYLISVSYGIAETRNGYNLEWPDANFALFSYYKVRIYGDRVVSSDLRGEFEGVNLILGRFKTTLVHLYFDQTFLSQT